MKFSLNDQELKLSCYKLDVKLAFRNGGVAWIDVDGHEFAPSDEILNGLIVKIPTGDRTVLLNNFALFTLQEVRREAERQWPEIVKEAQREEAKEAALADELSSPHRTGRI